MSTPNPTHIIAGHYWREYDRTCGCLWRPDSSPLDGGKELHAAHVVSALSDAGYIIMPAEEAWTLSRAQSLAFGTERMDSGDVEYSRGYNTAVEAFRDVLRVADVEGEKP